MAEGGTKDAEFIALKTILPIARTIDESKTCLDLFLIDSASNVQKASTALLQLYPRIQVCCQFGVF